MTQGDNSKQYLGLLDSLEKSLGSLRIDDKKGFAGPAIDGFRVRRSSRNDPVNRCNGYKPTREPDEGLAKLWSDDPLNSPPDLRFPERTSGFPAECFSKEKMDRREMGNVTS
ncbi:hypothetical protein CA13_39790 [Planctomycetes bacterium CA13]|uniref:Uncharacterized protein n=1 Tax=Novipirellula herctigrandis TaxID=2527986 RepID=A0A5C5Z617_9BACT|nr:hypothetical protein CA13_39790 [Planctomycetes bacterium CA13]